MENPSNLGRPIIEIPKYIYRVDYKKKRGIRKGRDEKGRRIIRGEKKRKREKGKSRKKKNLDYLA